MNRILYSLILLLAPLVSFGAITLTDNFDDNSIDGAKWTTTTSGGVVREIGGMMELIVPPLTNNAYAQLKSASTYDMADSAATVQYLKAANPSVDSSLQMYNSGTPTSRMMWLCGPTTCYVQIQQAGVDKCTGATVCATVTLPTGPSPNTWLRIREASGTTYFEYSTDKTTSWTNAYSTTTASFATWGITTTSLTIMLEAYEYAATGAGTDYNSVFDNFGVAACDPSTSVCGDFYLQSGYDAWTAPTGVTTAQVACWGAGGGAGDGTNAGSQGGGGGAFASSSVSVSAGTTYTLNVGTGGAGATVAAAAGTNGGTTTFATTTVVAAPGWRGQGASAATTTAWNNGGATASSTGDVEYAGGMGGAGGNADDAGGGGGGAAGPHGAGAAGANATATLGGEGGQGDNANGGTGGTAPTGAVGGNATTSFLGGGGGGGGDNTFRGGFGAGIGGGGGGGEANATTGYGRGGTGACYIQYQGTPASPATQTSTSWFINFE